MTRDCVPPHIVDQNRSDSGENLSRCGFLLAGTFAGLSLPLTNDEGEAAVGGGVKPMRPVRSKTLIEGETITTAFPGFSNEMVETHGTTIHVLRKGVGQPLLLLHYPETGPTWRKVAPQLAEQFSVVVPDLRGYGDSGKPLEGEPHANSSFRAMAQDQVDVMHHYGHERLLVVAHDRGARATHRLCLDHPERVERACLMDIAPTLTMYQGTNQEFATKYMWWFFLIQSFPLPEHMIGLDPDFYLQQIFGGLNKTPGSIAPDVMNEYVRQ
jgi:haloacetate dehalogenase